VSDKIRFLDIYIHLCSALKYLHDGADICEYGSNEDESFFRFRMAVKNDKDILLKELLESCDSISKNFQMSSNKQELIEIAKELKQNHEHYSSSLIENFLKFGNQFEKEPEGKGIVMSLFDNFGADCSISQQYEIIGLLKSVHFAAWNVEKLLTLDSLSSNDNFFLLMECNLTHLFINLHSLVENLRTNENYESDLKDIVNRIKIDEYTIFKGKSQRPVVSIDQLIKHYRDAVCHLEFESKNITQHSDGGNRRLVIWGKKIQYGEGMADWDGHILKFIRLLTSLLTGKKTYVMVRDINKDRYLYSMVCTDNWTLMGMVSSRQFRIEFNSEEDIFTIFLKKLL
jgi:hypothetical protein